MSENMKASIIIPSRGMEPGLRRLLDALVKEIGGQKVEVILVDDGSEKALNFLETEYGGKLNLKVERQSPQGPAAARNLGVKRAVSAILIFLDSDVAPLPGWFSAMSNRMESNPDLAGVEGKTVSQNLEELNPFSHFLDNLEGGKYLTCNIGYHREWIEKAGGFDERFRHPWREDSDLAFSILELGGKIGFEPNAVVDHPVRPVRPFRLFWFYPIRRGYDWLLYRKHPQLYLRAESGFADLSELSFFISFALAAVLFTLGWIVPGFITLIFHQAIYNHIMLRRLSYGPRVARNLAVPWKVFAKSYLFFYPAVFLSLASILWGWARFGGVRPAKKNGIKGG